MTSFKIVATKVPGLTCSATPQTARGSRSRKASQPATLRQRQSVPSTTWLSSFAAWMRVECTGHVPAWFPRAKRPSRIAEPASLYGCLACDIIGSACAIGVEVTLCRPWWRPVPSRQIPLARSRAHPHRRWSAPTGVPPGAINLLEWTQQFSGE